MKPLPLLGTTYFDAIENTFPTICAFLKALANGVFEYFTYYFGWYLKANRQAKVEEDGDVMTKCSHKTFWKIVVEKKKQLSTVHLFFVVTNE